jgi:hypothetical protein
MRLVCLLSTVARKLAGAFVRLRAQDRALSGENTRRLRGRLRLA